MSSRPAGRRSRSNTGRSAGRSRWPSRRMRPSGRRTTVTAGPTKRIRPATSSPVRNRLHASSATLASRVSNSAWSASRSSTRTSRSTTSGPHQRMRASMVANSSLRFVWRSIQPWMRTALSGTCASAKRSRPSTSAARITRPAKVPASTRQIRAVEPRPGDRLTSAPRRTGRARTATRSAAGSACPPAPRARRARRTPRRAGAR